MNPDIQRILLLSDQLLDLSEKESQDEIDAMAALALALLCIAKATGANDRAIDSLITCLRHVRDYYLAVKSHDFAANGQPRKEKP